MNVNAIVPSSWIVVAGSRDEIYFELPANSRSFRYHIDVEAKFLAEFLTSHRSIFRNFHRDKKAILESRTDSKRFRSSYRYFSSSQRVVFELRTNRLRLTLHRKLRNCRGDEDSAKTQWFLSTTEGRKEGRKELSRFSNFNPDPIIRYPVNFTVTTETVRQSLALFDLRAASLLDELGFPFSLRRVTSLKNWISTSM